MVVSALGKHMLRHYSHPNIWLHLVVKCIEPTPSFLRKTISSIPSIIGDSHMEQLMVKIRVSRNRGMSIMLGT